MNPTDLGDIQSGTIIYILSPSEQQRIKVTAVHGITLSSAPSLTRLHRQLLMTSGLPEPVRTCQLFLCLRRVCVPEQSHGLCDATAAIDLLLVLVVFKGQVTQGGRGRLVDVHAGTAQQSHQSRDPVEL